MDNLPDDFSPRWEMTAPGSFQIPEEAGERMRPVSEVLHGVLEDADLTLKFAGPFPNAQVGNDSSAPETKEES